MGRSSPRVDQAVHPRSFVPAEAAPEVYVVRPRCRLPSGVLSDGLEDVVVGIRTPHHSLAMARAAVLLLTVVGCSGDPAGPTLVDDALRVPLTAAINEAERSTAFFAIPVVGVVGLVDLTIALSGPPFL